MDDTSARSESTDVPTGVWIHPSGTRFEADRQDDGWHIAVYWVRKGGQPEAEHVFGDPEQANKAIAGLESEGYVRDTEREAGEPYTQWTPGNIVGATILLLVILGIGMALLS